MQEFYYIWYSHAMARVATLNCFWGGEKDLDSSDKVMRYSQNQYREKQCVMDSDEDDEGGCGGMTIPMCTRGASSPTSVYRRVVADNSWDTPEGIKAFTKTAYSYGTLPRTQSLRVSNLPTMLKDREEHIVIDILKVPAEDWAAQITLMDLPVFKSIKPDELTSVGWTKKEKLKVAPNVVEFTRRFNHITFWVVREILSVQSTKHRAETMGHFIRIAKKLNDYNNFHSQFAIISALQSASLYRLSKTWSYLSKKDKQHYERMAELFSDTNNWEKLRSHVNSLKLPMIPYLGLFLTDIVYTDMAHPHYGGLESEQRQLKMNNILRVLADYQLSDYSYIRYNQHVQTYLSSVRYIEELQKFVEDDHFKLSLQLEPTNPTSVLSSSKDSIGEACCSYNTSPIRHPSLPQSAQCPAHGSKFVPAHRKARSLGTKFRSMSLPRNLPRGETSARLGERLWSEFSSDSEDVILELNGGECGIQGPLKRKTLMKRGKKHTVAAWQRYWVQLWGGALVYYHAKSLTSRGLERSDFKTSPCKLQHLETPNGRLKILGATDPQKPTDSFKIVDDVEENVYKFRAPSISAAVSWVNSLSHSLNGVRHEPPENLISFD